MFFHHSPGFPSFVFRRHLWFVAFDRVQFEYSSVPRWMKSQCNDRSWLEWITRCASAARARINSASRSTFCLSRSRQMVIFVTSRCNGSMARTRSWCFCKQLRCTSNPLDKLEHVHLSSLGCVVQSPAQYKERLRRLVSSDRFETLSCRTKQNNVTRIGIDRRHALGTSCEDHYSEEMFSRLLDVGHREDFPERWRGLESFRRSFLSVCWSACVVRRRSCSRIWSCRSFEWFEFLSRRVQVCTLQLLRSTRWSLVQRN